MTASLGRVALVACALLLSACSAAPTPTPRAVTVAPSRAASTAAGTSPTASPNSCAVSPQRPPQATLSTGFATALAFAPDGRLFWTVRSGAVMVWQDGAAHTFASVPTVTAEAGGSYSERGLLGLAISPSFSTDRFVYAFYSDADRATQHVIRWHDCRGIGTAATVIVTLPAGGDCCHKGGRIAFGADGKLYVTLGDEHSAAAAQNPGDPRGKVLRFNPDGSVPADNPFGAGNPAWAYGLRNPFGIAFSAGGQLAITSNGPSGDAGSPPTGYDTVFLDVREGEGLQWPLCYGYSHPLDGPAGCDGRAAPDWSSESSTVIPTGAAFVDDAAPQPYAGHLVLCTYGRGMLIVTPGAPHASVTAGPSACRLDVVEGPDHALYWSDTGHIYRQA
ncbi:MAG: PQQ-dependent sugar dehydrogenase [Candidatus Dormibacteria bacterium]